MKNRLLLFLLLPMSIMPGTNAQQTGANHSGTNALEQQEWKSYSNTNLNLSFRYPADWRVSEHLEEDPAGVINILPVSDTEKLRLPLHIHTEPEISFISIFPNGHGSELPSGKNQTIQKWKPGFNAGLTIHPERSSVFLLENDSAWGFFLYPRELPPQWDQSAFIFIQAGVRNYVAECFDAESGKKIPMEECEPLDGDDFKRYGNLNTGKKQVLLRILQSIEYENGQPSLSGLIEVEKPLPNEAVSSPIRLRGKARGDWFFEDSFPVHLEDPDGNKIATATATALKPWATTDWVPFEAELKFKPPPGEKAFLVLERANPSGKAEHKQSYRLPVLVSQNK